MASQARSLSGLLVMRESRSNDRLDQTTHQVRYTSSLCQKTCHWRLKQQPRVYQRQPRQARSSAEGQYASLAAKRCIERNPDQPSTRSGLGITYGGILIERRQPIANFATMRLNQCLVFALDKFAIHILHLDFLCLLRGDFRHAIHAMVGHSACILVDVSSKYILKLGFVEH